MPEAYSSYFNLLIANQHVINNYKLWHKKQNTSSKILLGASCFDFISKFVHFQDVRWIEKSFSKINLTILGWLSY